MPGVEQLEDAQLGLAEGVACEERGERLGAEACEATTTSAT